MITNFLQNDYFIILDLYLFWGAVWAETVLFEKNIEQQMIIKTNYCQSSRLS